MGNGEKLKEETRGDENGEFYEHWMDVYDDAVEDERYAHYVEDLDEDTFLSPEIDGSPKGYFHLFPNGKVHSVVSRHIHVEDPETISLDKVDVEDEVEKFKKKYSNALQFLEKFFGGNNVNVRFLVTGYAI